MFVYIFAILLCIIFSYLGVICKDKRKTFFNILPMLILFIISALRYNVGIDYSGTYTEVYYWVLDGVKNIRMDPGFVYIYKFIIMFNLDLQWFFVISSFFINLFVYLAIERISSNKVLSWFIYICSTFYFFTMNGIRQSFVMAVFYWSLVFIKKKDVNKFLILTFILSFFHMSALIFIPVYFLANYKFKSKNIFIIILIILCFISPLILPVLIQVLSGTKYVLYFLHNNYNPLNSLNFSSLFNLLLFIVYLYKLNFKSNDDTYGYIFMLCHFIGVCLSIFLTSIPLVLRLFQSFRFIEFLSIPYLFDNYFKKNKFVLYVGVISFYIFYFIFHVLINNANGVLPYLTIFER